MSLVLDMNYVSHYRLFFQIHNKQANRIGQDLTRPTTLMILTRSDG